MISKIVKSLIEKQFGHPIKYSRDCEALAANISTACKCKISATTIRRLFGVTKSNQNPRPYTLDILAQYIGYNDYDKLIASLNKNDKGEENSITEISTDSLRKGEKFEITYSPNKILTILYIGKKQFKVLHSKNSLLKQDDVFKLSYFALHHPLFILEVVREGESVGKIIEAKVSGVTLIKKL
ncbi:MAG TPA: hypothetical protein VN026_12365 [Bacteroidia bacterium]|jgi:hypothetical protein|nr:hypothetical protein [Bacteroidia bacterium]